MSTIDMNEKMEQPTEMDVQDIINASRKMAYDFMTTAESDRIKNSGIGAVVEEKEITAALIAARATIFQTLYLARALRECSACTNDAAKCCKTTQRSVGE